MARVEWDGDGAGGGAGMAERGLTARLDIPADHGETECLVFTDPAEVIEAWAVDEVRVAIRAAEAAARRGSHVVGFLAYEAAQAFDPGLRVRGGARLPLAWFAVFDRVAEGIGEAGGGGDGGAGHTTSPSDSAVWEPDTPRGDYDAAIAELKAAFERGEVDQVNYTLRLRSVFDGDPLAFYEDLLAAQGRAYGAYLDLGTARIISVSPELFFHRQGGRITLRPMKGTARRGRWLEEDLAVRRRLAESVKDRTENMITLEAMRGELEALARPGTVVASRLCEVERYPTVHQMTSTLEAELSEGTTLEGIFAGLFPSASVTGVPRAAATRKIADLERSPREVYCGAIGLIRPGGDAIFNVAIRTVWIDGRSGVAEYGVGGGITTLSTAEGEYDELLAKSAVLRARRPEFELLETMRLVDGEYLRLERHLARLCASAAWFGWSDPVEEVRSALAAHAAERPSGVWRVRVLAGAGGGVRVESVGFEGEAGGGNGEPKLVRLARRPISRGEIFLYHKTTNRRIHEARRAEAPDAYDVLLWNEDGDLTEFTIGNLVVEIEGVRWTPPRECGLLAGVFRGELLERGEIGERVLHLSDLAAADRIWLINSLREWVPVKLAE